MFSLKKMTAVLSVSMSLTLANCPNIDTIKPILNGGYQTEDGWEMPKYPEHIIQAALAILRPPTPAPLQKIKSFYGVRITPDYISCYYELEDKTRLTLNKMTTATPSATTGHWHRTLLSETGYWGCLASISNCTFTIEHKEKVERKE